MSELEVLSANTGESIARRLELLAGGAPEDYPAYRQLVGEIAGLRESMQLMRDLQERLEQD